MSSSHGVVPKSAFTGMRLLMLVLTLISSALCATSVDVKQITMPRLSSTMTEGVLSSWQIAVGDHVQAGTLIATIESDKAEMDMEAFEEGYVAKLLVQNGDTVKVDEPIALLVADPSLISLVDSHAVKGGMDRAVHFISDSGTPSIPQAQDITLSKPLLPPSTTYVSFQSSAPSSVASALPILHFPSGVDQDVRDQLPPGTTPDMVVDMLFNSTQNIPDIQRQISALEATAGGKEFLEQMKKRAALRLPSPHILASVNQSRHEPVNMNATVTNPPQKPVPQWHPGPNAIVATPKARTLAAKKGVELANVIGTGRFNRITEEDVRSFTQSPTIPRNAVPPISTAPSPLRQPLSPMQRAIAANMAKTVNTPVFRLTASMKVSKLQNLYRSLKPKGITWSSLLAKAVATILAQPEHNILNASFQEAENMVIHHDGVHIAMAVATPDNGLMTPVIHDVDRKNINTVANEWTTLVNKVTKRTIRPDECAGGTFYISNLGQYGIDQFDAILPNGAGAILSVGTTFPRIDQTMSSDGPVKVTNSMSLTLTCDHRHINGADAGAFLQALRELIEQNPERLLY